MRFSVINNNHQKYVLEGRFRDAKSGVTYPSAAKVVIHPNKRTKFRSHIFTKACIEEGMFLDVHLMDTDGITQKTYDHYKFEKHANATLEVGSDGFAQMTFSEENVRGKEKESGFSPWIRYLSFL